MVEKKINFNQPILSVRRCSLKMPSNITDETKTKNVTPRLHPHRRDLNSGPVNPGGVPFQWEQIPGKPKEETERQHVNRYPNIGDNEMKDDDCDEPLVDEVDSLSRTESFVSSCSMSSINGVDDLDDDSSRTFSMDPREVKKEVVKQEKPGFWYRPTFAKSCSYYNDKEEKQVCDDHGHDEHESLLTVCCLFPRSCLKSTVCFVNPVPATSVMARFAVFPSTGCSSADSLSETENEDTVKSAVKTDDELRENKNKANVVKDIARLEDWDGRLSFFEGFESCNGSFKTLQELLADDEGNKKELKSTCDDHFNVMSNLVDEKSGKISPKPFGSDEYLYVDSRKKSDEKQKLARCTTIGNSIPKFPVPPPLPRSPSDSWLFRTISMKKVSRSSFISRCSSKS